MNQVNLPNFFIVGAAKAGTSSLWRYVNQHPDIFMPKDFYHKEPSYFVSHYGMSSFQEYRSLFRGATQDAVGEASTAYLTCEHSAQAIASHVPDAKIIVMLRNPARRAYSLYNWMAQEGYEYALSFDRALRLEEKRWQSSTFRRNNPQYFWNYMYFRSGCYAPQVQRYLDVFGKENVRILLFEDFINDAHVYCSEVFSFLGVDPTFQPNTAVHNPSKYTPFPPLQVFLRRLTSVGVRIRNRLLKQRLTSKERRDFMLKLGQLKRKPPKIEASTYRSLMARYETDITKLETLIDANPTRWMESFPRQ